MKLFKRKKAITDVIYLGFVCIPFGAVILTLCWVFASGLVGGNIDIGDIQHLILEKRITNSQNSMIYTDKEIDRSYAGIVDLDRFDTDILEKAFNTEPLKISAKLELTNLRTNEKETAYINKKLYDIGADLTKFKKYDLKVKWKYVLIKNQNTFDKGLLKLEVVSTA